MSAGKGDKYRPINKKKYDQNFDMINFSKWYVYLVRCNDDTLYCGITNNLDKRIETHNKGTGAKYTSTRKPVRLEYSETCANKSDALKREIQIKKMSRKDKICLINGYNLKED